MERSSSTSYTSGGKKNSAIFKLDSDGNAYSNHDMLAIRRVARPRSVRNGDIYYGCPLWSVNLDEFLKEHGKCKCRVWKEQEFTYMKVKI
ncbi:hypothetical protein Hanom_Chr14g01249331 [Helianthus anomalus]